MKKIVLLICFMFVVCSTFTSKPHGVKVSIGMDHDYTFSLFENSNSEEEVELDENGDAIYFPYLSVSGTSGLTGFDGDLLTISSIGTITTVSGNKPWSGKIEINATDSTKVNCTKSIGFLGQISLQYTVSDGFVGVTNTCNITIKDDIKPVINLYTVGEGNKVELSKQFMTVEYVLYGEEYSDLGGVVTDNVDGDIPWTNVMYEDIGRMEKYDFPTVDTIITKDLNIEHMSESLVCSYDVDYKVYDSAGNFARAFKEIYVLNPDGDYDHDGLTNRQELEGIEMPVQLLNYYKSIGEIAQEDTAVQHKIFTEPGNNDTDGDDVSDGDEILKYFTDPLKIDTDGDGWSDYDEIEYGADSLNPTPELTIEEVIEGNSDERSFEELREILKDLKPVEGDSGGAAIPGDDRLPIKDMVDDSELDKYE